MTWPVHQAHCCASHGCKYNNDACPVTEGWATQDNPCEQCGHEREEMKELLKSLFTGGDAEAVKVISDALASHGYKIVKISE